MPDQKGQVFEEWNKAFKMLGTDKQHMSPQFYDQPVAAMGVMPAVPGGWRRDDVVTYFDELWRSAWKRQDPELKFATSGDLSTFSPFFLLGRGTTSHT